MDFKSFGNIGGNIGNSIRCVLHPHPSPVR
jgi:hypothetical protein